MFLKKIFFIIYFVNINQDPCISITRNNPFNIFIIIKDCPLTLIVHRIILYFLFKLNQKKIFANQKSFLAFTKIPQDNNIINKKNILKETAE